MRPFGAHSLPAAGGMCLEARVEGAAGGGGAEGTPRGGRGQRVAGRERHVRPRLSEAFSSAEWVAVRVPRGEVAPASARRTLGSTTAKVRAGVGSGPGGRPGPAAGPAGAGAAPPPGGGPGRGASAPDERGAWRPVAQPARSGRRVCRAVVSGRLRRVGSRLRSSRAADGMVGARGARRARVRRPGRARAGRGRRGAWAGSPQGGRGRRALLGRPLFRGIRSPRVISLIAGPARSGAGGSARRPFPAP